MAETPLTQLETSLKDAVNNSLDLKGLQEKFEAHIADLEQHKEEIVPKIKEVYARMIDTLINLETEQDRDRRTLLQRRLGSLKRAHLSYLKSLEVAAAWKAANSLWDTVQHVKDFMISLIYLVPA